MEPVAAPAPVEANAPSPHAHHAPKTHHPKAQQQNQAHGKQRREQAKQTQPKPPQAPAEKKPDAHQLPPFLLRPIPLPKEKPAAAATPRKKVKATA